VLLHASYPYVREQGYLAAIYPNVYADLGLAVPYVAANIPALLRDAFALTPTSKLLFSTDAYSFPTSSGSLARWGRRGLAHGAGGDGSSIGALASDEGARASRVTSSAATPPRLYGLPWPVVRVALR
jgi:hypothetical protein